MWNIPTNSENANLPILVMTSCSVKTSSSSILISAESTAFVLPQIKKKIKYCTVELAILHHQVALLLQVIFAHRIQVDDTVVSA